MMWNEKRRAVKTRAPATSRESWAHRGLTIPPTLHSSREAPIMAPCSPQRASSKSLPRQCIIRWAWGLGQGIL